MISKLPKRKYTQIAPGRVFYEFTLDKHLKELRDDDDGDTNNIEPSKNFLTKITFNNNSWFEALFSIDGITVIPKSEIMKSVFESSDSQKLCEYDLNFRLPRKAVKLRIDLFQPSLGLVLGGIENLTVEYKKLDSINSSSKTEDKNNNFFQVPTKRWTLDPVADYTVKKLFI